MTSSTPKTFDEGITSLLSQHSLDEVSLVQIPSLERGFDSIDVLMGLLNSSGIRIPDNRIFQYLPPNHVGYRDPSLPCREENIPEIKDPHLTYIIIDDLFQEGLTLGCAVKAVVEQGVPRENIWSLMGFITPPYSGVLGEYPYLDKADAFFDYRKKIRRGG